MSRDGRGLIMHCPIPGPLYWNWRCLLCDQAVDDHANWLQRLVYRWRLRKRARESCDDHVHSARSRCVNGRTTYDYLVLHTLRNGTQRVLPATTGDEQP